MPTSTCPPASRRSERLEELRRRLRDAFPETDTDHLDALIHREVTRVGSAPLDIALVVIIENNVKSGLHPR